MDISTECRYLYRIPAGSEWYVTEHYGCCTAVSMADARRHLKGISDEVVRVRLGTDGCLSADDGSQAHRKALFDAAFNLKRQEQQK